MNRLFHAIVLLHGAIHHPGFVIAFQIKEVKEQPFSIPQPMGMDYGDTIYAIFEEIRVPSRMRATRKPEEGDRTRLQPEITSMQYNENIDNERNIQP